VQNGGENPGETLDGQTETWFRRRLQESEHSSIEGRIKELKNRQKDHHSKFSSKLGSSNNTSKVEQSDSVGSGDNTSKEKIMA